jgi:hypothetical protein
MQSTVHHGMCVVRGTVSETSLSLSHGPLPPSVRCHMSSPSAALRALRRVWQKQFETVPMPLLIGRDFSRTRCINLGHYRLGDKLAIALANGLAQLTTPIESLLLPSCSLGPSGLVPPHTSSHPSHPRNLTCAAALSPRALQWARLSIERPRMCQCARQCWCCGAGCLVHSSERRELHCAGDDRPGEQPFRRSQRRRPRRNRAPPRNPDMSPPGR